MDSTIPSYWPRTLPYRTSSFSEEIPIEHLRLLLFPPRRSGFLSLIEERKIHPALEIKVLEEPHPLAGKRTSMGHINRGLFAKKSIRAGTYLGEYVGKVDMFSAGESRPPNCSTFAEFKWVVEHPHFSFTVDARFGANELALVNDFRSIAESPNCTPCFIAHKNVHYFGFKTTRTISPQEELLVDYGNEFWQHN